ncbi:MAG: aryl-sulfate sulfotransferase [Acidobacteriota bacterium]|nr:MAG: aryl-sulfate sulfotransferase [Acidobacteriota bacterium]
MRLPGYVVLLLCFLGASVGCTREDPAAAPAAPRSRQHWPDERGILQTSARAAEGLVLFAPLLSYTTYLIDKNGDVVQTWESDHAPGASAYLLDNGHLLRCGQHARPAFHRGGHGGHIQEFSWDGELVWDFLFSSEDRLQHHDIEPLPNGHVLLIAWEYKTPEQLLEAGRDPTQRPSRGLWPDAVYEVQPVPPNDGRIVWEWHLWDHLIQDLDPDRDNYGDVSQHPELIDINAVQAPPWFSDAVVSRLRALGYLGADLPPSDANADFTHINSIAYHPRLDQIVLSVLNFNEIWIIDHSTTTEQAASHSGGRAGKGGDLLYRWGNPRSYGRGGARHQQLFNQHDARWIPEGYPSAGNITVFNNGSHSFGRRYSSVTEIVPPLTPDGRYAIASDQRFGPVEPVWEYTAANRGDFFADFISSAQRLPNGNTLICDGPEGRFFEVAATGDIVWAYSNPFTGSAPNPHGDPPYSVFRATHIPLDHPALPHENRM